MLKKKSRRKVGQTFNWKCAVSCDATQFIGLLCVAIKVWWLKVTIVIESNDLYFHFFFIGLTMRPNDQTTHFNDAQQPKRTKKWAADGLCAKNSNSLIKNDISCICVRPLLECAFFSVWFGLVLIFYGCYANICEDLIEHQKPWQYFNWLRFNDTLTLLFWRCIFYQNKWDGMIVVAVAAIKNSINRLASAVAVWVNCEFKFHFRCCCINTTARLLLSSTNKKKKWRRQ